MKKKSVKSVKPSNASANQATLSSADLNNAVSAAELLDIKLTASTFNVKPEFFASSFSNPEEQKSLEYGFDKIEYDVSPIEDEEGCIGTAFADAAATVSLHSDVVLEIKAKYLISYAFEGENNLGAAEAFLKRVVRFSIYPYFRQLVATYSAACGADLPTLPVFKEAILATSKAVDKKRQNSPRQNEVLK